MLKFLIMAVLLPTTALAEDWVDMTGVGIEQVLTNWDVVYPEATQRFFKSGRTRYTTSTDSWGQWDVRNDQYCSQWPPATGWACYDMQMDAKDGDLRFIGESGTATDGKLLPRN